MMRTCCFLPRVVLRLIPVLLLCAAAVAQAQVPTQTRGIRVPYLVGRTQTQASAILERLRLPMAVETACTSDDVGLGLVAYQRPDSGFVQRLVTVTLGVTAFCQPAERILRVPNVVGLHVDSVRGALAREQFALGEVSVRDRFNVAAGIVLDQNPDAGTELRLPVTFAAPPQPPSVAVVIASNITVVPPLVGMSEARVGSVLQRVQLVAGGVRNVPSGATPGTVVSQDPPPRMRVAKGSPVSVDVAVADVVVVPDVQGMHIDRAAQLLADAGLTLDEPTVRDQFDAPARIVLEQFPQPTQTVQRGARVLVTISSDWTEVPSLGQTHRDDMGAALARVRLRAGGQSEVPSEANTGLIIGQDPQPGARVLKNTAVSVDVAVPLPPPPVLPPEQPVPPPEQPVPPPEQPVPPAEQPVVVPNVIGLSRADADALLASSNLVLALGGDVRTGDYPAGAVASQFPPAGTRLRANSAVTLNLAVAPLQIPWDIILILGIVAALAVTAAVVGRLRARSKARIAAPQLDYVPKPYTVRVWRVPHDAVAHGFSLQLRGMPNRERDHVELHHE